MDVIGLILMALCLIPAWIGRKRIQFLFCPSEVIGFHKKNQYFGLYSLLPSLIIAGFLIAYVREFIREIEYLKEYDNLSIVIGLVVFTALLYVSGLVANFIVYYSDERYRKWIDQKKGDD
ncbi:hypothetical protein [Carboxylicivirga marina]|uniref:hypothetical protein n=1 Tax=Carboxylicivirga marina TaxID=2800988 RepID=UPI00259A0899|nr:hypothetical protein [uncultured Carboxylicivirga sp.]